MDALPTAFFPLGVRRAAAAVAAAALSILAWHVFVVVAKPPHFILPGPTIVAAALWREAGLIAAHAAPTAIEIVAALALGAGLGAATAIAVTQWRWARRLALPAVVASQALPVFALAPIFVLWLGYGMASKIAMATLIVFFPVATALADGLRRADPASLDLARLAGASPWRTLRLIRLPGALPAFGSGLRVAAAVAPIGAVIGEWVGSAAGLGYLMLHANARMQTDLMFAALAVLAAMALGLYFAVDALARRISPWAPESAPAFADLEPGADR